MITIVSGNMRCGTSLVMRMLGAGGLPLFYDQPDSFEHSGYLDYMRHGDTDWLDRADGHAVKWLDPMIHGFPPPTRDYRIIVLTRDATQQHRSQIKFLKALGGVSLCESRAGRQALAKDNARLADEWAKRGPVWPFTFEFLIDHPADAAAMLSDVCDLGQAPVRAMAAQVVERASACLPDLLEMRFPVGLWRGVESMTP